MIYLLPYKDNKSSTYTYMHTESSVTIQIMFAIDYNNSTIDNLYLITNNNHNTQL